MKKEVITNQDSENYILRLHLENHHVNPRKGIICDYAKCPKRGQKLTKEQADRATNFISL